ncbi:hypothetical protein SRHO_G00199590 [Serrasalmus rhombeus]
METLMDKPKKGSARDLNEYERIVQPSIAELVGTAFFVSAVCRSLRTWRRPADCSLRCGSHFNPPFTMAIYLCGGIKLFLAVPYVACQLIGGVLGAAMAKLTTTNEHYARAHGAAFTVLHSDEQVLQALYGEIAMTWLITMVVLLGAVNAKSKTPLVPFLVGSTIIIKVLAGSAVAHMGKLGRRCFKPITRPAGRSPAGLPGRGRGAPLRSLARFPTKTAASVVGSLADGAQARVKCPRRESTIVSEHTLKTE